MSASPRIIDCQNHIGAELLFYLNGDHTYARDIPSLVGNVGAQCVFPEHAEPIIPFVMLDPGVIAQIACSNTLRFLFNES